MNVVLRRRQEDMKPKMIYVVMKLVLHNATKVFNNCAELSSVYGRVLVLRNLDVASGHCSRHYRVEQTIPFSSLSL